MPRFIPDLTGLSSLLYNNVFLVFSGLFPFKTTYGALYSGIREASLSGFDKNNITGNATISSGSLNVSGNITVSGGNITLTGTDGRTNIGYSNTLNGTNILNYGHSNILNGSEISVFGKNNTSAGDNLVNIGYSNQFSGVRVVNIGFNNVLGTGRDSVIIGYGNSIAPNNTGVLIWGDTNRVSAFRAYVNGSENIVSGDDCVVMGLRNTLVSGSGSTSIERSDIFGRSNLVSGGILTHTYGAFNCQYGNLSNIYGNLNTNYASGTISIGTGNFLSGTATGSMNIGFGIVTIRPNVIEIGLNNTGKVTIDALGNLTVTGNLNYNGTLTFLNGNFAGSGNPNGVIAANPGARYLDTGWGIGYTGHLVTWVKWSGANGTSVGWG